MKVNRLVSFSQNDLNVPILVTLAYDCENEIIIAEVYSSQGILMGNVNAILPMEGDPFPTGIALGGAEGTEVSVRCNFKNIEQGDKYSLVFRTQGTGVVAKFPLLIYNKSGIYLPSECSKDSPESSFVTNGDGNKFLANDGTYKYVSGTKTKQKTIYWTQAMQDSFINEESLYAFFIPDIDSVHEVKISGTSIPDQYEFWDLLFQTITFDATKIEFVVGDRITIDYYPIFVEDPEPGEGVFQDEFYDEFA